MELDFFLEYKGDDSVGIRPEQFKFTFKLEETDLFRGEPEAREDFIKIATEKIKELIAEVEPYMGNDMNFSIYSQRELNEMAIADDFNLTADEEAMK